MKKLLIVLLAALCLPQIVAADDEVSMEEFVARARRTNQQATYARLYGTLLHRRRGQANLTMPVYFGAILHPDRTVGQLVLNGTEGYTLTQTQGSGVTGVRLMPGASTGDKLGYVGVRASDLVMSFLFCRVERELESELLRGMVHCRVFIFDDPDNQEKIKVWISSEHAFPLKAEFYRYGEDTRFRELEASALTKKNDLYYVRRIQLEGPGWTTRIDFDADRADIGLLGNPPQNVIIPLQQ